MSDVGFECLLPPTSTSSSPYTGCDAAAGDLNTPQKLCDPHPVYTPCTVPRPTALLDDHHSECWSNDEDRCVLSVCRDHGASEEVFKQAAQQLHNKTWQQVRLRLLMLIGLLKKDEVSG